MIDLFSNQNDLPKFEYTDQDICFRVCPHSAHLISIIYTSCVPTKNFSDVRMQFLKLFLLQMNYYFLCTFCISQMTARMSNLLFTRLAEAECKIQFAICTSRPGTSEARADGGTQTKFSYSKSTLKYTGTVVRLPANARPFSDELLDSKLKLPLTQPCILPHPQRMVLETSLCFSQTYASNFAKKQLSKNLQRDKIETKKDFRLQSGGEGGRRTMSLAGFF